MMSTSSRITPAHELETKTLERQLQRGHDSRKETGQETDSFSSLLVHPQHSPTTFPATILSNKPQRQEIVINDDR